MDHSARGFLRCLTSLDHERRKGQEDSRLRADAKGDVPDPRHISQHIATMGTERRSPSPRQINKQAFRLSGQHSQNIHREQNSDLARKHSQPLPAAKDLPRLRANANRGERH